MQLQKFYSTKHVLVTGGAGFIGSHIVHRLVELGATVTVLDDFSSGARKNIEPVSDHITLIEGTIVDYNTCLQATKDISHVFHLAALVSVPDSMKRPLFCHTVNVTGTANILEAAKVNKVQHVITSSSSAVYGTHQGICSENTACRPVSPYGLSKYIAEQYCTLYAQQFSLATTCLRYFNVYGPRQNPNGHYAAVVAKFNDQLEKNGPITIFGDGKQTRDFVPVTEVVDANLTLGMDASTGSNIYNIGTGESITLLKLVDELRKEHPTSTSKIQFAPPRQGDIYHSKANCLKYITTKKHLIA